MSIDWDRRHCARKGHITYAPDEARLHARLQASTAVGTAWRCLRCGDFVLGEPHGSGPADRAPLVPRGKALRDLFILRVLAVERVLRGLLIVLAAWAVWKFSNSQDAVAEALRGRPDGLQAGRRALPLRPGPLAGRRHHPQDLRLQEVHAPDRGRRPAGATR